MNRTVAYLIGPELVWVLMLGLTAVVIAANQPLTALGHLKLISLNSYLPAIGVMIAFVPLFWASGSQWGWLARIGFSSLIGVILLVGFLSRAASYNDIRDMGVSVTFMVFVILGWSVLAIVGSIAILFLVAHWPFLPVLKWILIIFTLFLIAMHILWKLT